MAEMLSIEPCAILQAESWPGMPEAFEAELWRQLDRANLSEPFSPPLRGEGKGEGLGDFREAEEQGELKRGGLRQSPSPYLSPQVGRGNVGVAGSSAAKQPSAPAERLSTFGHVIPIGPWQTVRIAPRRFWLIAAAAPNPPWSIDPALGCISPLHEGRMRLKLAGPYTFDILAACVAIDWNAPEAQPGRAVQASFHHVPVLALRNAADACDLLVPRSFAHSLAEWITEVAEPYKARSPLLASEGARPARPFGKDGGTQSLRAAW